MDDVEQKNVGICDNIKTEFLNSASENVKVKFLNKIEPITPSIASQKRINGKVIKRAATTTRKKSFQNVEVAETAAFTTSKIVVTGDYQTTAKKNSRSKDPPPSQLRIDNFFKSSTKSYKIEARTAKDEEIYSVTRTCKKSKTTKKRGAKRKQINKGRKRLFQEEDECTTTVSTVSGFTNMTTTPARNTPKRLGLNAARGSIKKAKQTSEDILDILIDLISEDEKEGDVKPNLTDVNIQLHPIETKQTTSYVRRFPENNGMQSSAMVSIPVQHKEPEEPLEHSKYMENIKSEPKDVIQVKCSAKKILLPKSTVDTRKGKNGKSNVEIVQMKKDTIIDQAQRDQPCSTSSMNKATTRKKFVKIKNEAELLVATPPSPPQTSTDTFSSNCVSNLVANKNPSLNTVPLSTSKGGRVKKVRVCPPYKIIAGTTFAVDAFQFGQIEGITHYFLTHFHADHYQGLTRKFSMPLYLSPLTARLVRALIPVDDQYLYEIELNTPLVINGVEITTIDANHCPGAVLFLFKLSTGRCILHTGDFRASPDMESEPMFWNNWIDTIYLDTTYIAHKHNFCSQYESIDRAKSIIEKFHKERPATRILYICGSYVIGKERFWTSLAHEFGLKVWTEKNRLTALRAMDLEEVRGLLCDDPYVAQMHVISIGKVGYQSLVEYFRPFQQRFDAVLAFRPSGWEKNTNPSLRGQISIVGIEYSEHSSHAELERFVTYLKPREVISTVPVMQGNPCITPKIPEKWYKYVTLKSKQRNFQPSITSYIKMRPRMQPTHTTAKRTTNCLTPKKSPGCAQNELSQLSVRAMTTCVLQEVESDDDVVWVDEPAPSGKAPATVAPLLPDEDAVDDWIS